LDKLYVGNMSFTTKESDVIDHFSVIGKVASIKMISDKETGMFRGFCFIEMENGDQAIKLCNGKEIFGRKLTVSAAKGEQSGPKYPRRAF